MRPRPSGFTLIELMITVAVVAILAAIAYPSYQQHVRKSRRAEAQAFMMAVAARQQQFLVDTRSYADTLDTVGVPTPANVSLAYTPALAASAPATTFTLTLTPKAIQAAETCGTLSIDHVGIKTPATSGCW
jgi:type IV pilus assembly protein PilE